MQNAQISTSCPCDVYWLCPRDGIIADGLTKRNNACGIVGHESLC